MNTIGLSNEITYSQITEMPEYLRLYNIVVYQLSHLVHCIVFNYNIWGSTD